MEDLENILPMNLQFFAETGDNQSSEHDNNSDQQNSSQDDNNPDTQDNDGTQENDSSKGDTDKNEKVISKLRERVGHEQSKKNELQDQLTKVQQELAELKDGGKKEKAKTPEQLEVENLKKQIARRDTIDQTLDVFRDNGLSIPKDIVSMLVVDNSDKTIDNANKLLDFVTQVKTDTEADIRAEYTGAKAPKVTHHASSGTPNFGETIAKSTSSRTPLQGKY